MVMEKEDEILPLLCFCFTSHKTQESSLAHMMERIIN